jgi:RNA polymerase sigma factor (sigma-70 family)
MASEDLCALEYQRLTFTDGIKDEPARLVELHNPLIVRTARKFGRDRDTAQDIAQGARLRILGWARRNPGRECSRSLVRQAVRCAAVEVVRERQRSLSALGSENVERLGDAHANLLAVEAADEDVIARKVVAQRVAALPLKLRAVFCGIYRRDISQRELASRMRLSQARVAQLHGELLRLGRARFGPFPTA